jgi:hypothetical protein
MVSFKCFKIPEPVVMKEYGNTWEKKNLVRAQFKSSTIQSKIAHCISHVSVKSLDLVSMFGTFIIIN